MPLYPRRNHGFSLVELMVALVAGLIVSYAVVAFVLSSMKSNGEYVQSTKLTETLRNSLDLVVRDLRRAGYDDSAIARLAGGASSAAVGLSPFTPMLLDNTNTSPTSGACLIYAYDRPGGTAGTLDVSNGEVRGIRRVVVTPTGASTSVGVIEYATSADLGSGAAKPTCAGASAVYTSYPPSCNATTHWCPLTDSATINIRSFGVAENSSTIVGSDPNAVRIRNFTVAMTARLVGDDATSYLNGVSTSYKRGVQAEVKVRSDCVNTTIANCSVSP
jgi:prepilin-type N-terminal cleavage/methylation domain-containing protein